MINLLENLQSTATKQTTKNQNKPLYILLDTINNEYLLSDLPSVRMYKTKLIHTYYNGEIVK